MQIPLLLLGIILILAVSVDMIRTIIFLNGAGAISKWYANLIWQVFFKISGKNGKSPLLTFAGGTILISLIFLWIIMIWAGFSLIFISDPDSVLNATTKIPADIVGNIYYVGYTLTSLGNGDLVSGSNFWRIISNILGITSMFFVTVGISYLLPVLQAVIAKRSLAIYIAKLGDSPEDLLNNSWNGKDFNGLYSRFGNLESMLIQHSERHLAYPILHYFHSNIKEYSAPVQLAMLDEVLSIQEVYGLDSASNLYHWRVLRGAIDNFLARLDNTFIGSSDEIPPFNYKNLPEHDNLSEAEVKSKLQKYDDRRRKLLGLIQKDGWEWEDVTGNFI